MKCNFRPNCILKQELRCYDLRSKSLKKPPFRPHFRPFCPHPAYGSSLRAEGCTHFLAPPASAWHPRPPGHWSPAPSFTTPGPAGSGRAQTFPRWLLPSTDRGLTEIERGPISTIGLPYYDDRPPLLFSMSPNRATASGKSNFSGLPPVGAPGRVAGGHFRRAQPSRFAHGCAPTGEHLRGYFLVERNSFRFSRLLADLHHLTTAKIWVAGGGAGGDIPDALASALGLPYG